MTFISAGKKHKFAPVENAIESYFEHAQIENENTFISPDLTQ